MFCNGKLINCPGSNIMLCNGLIAVIKTSVCNYWRSTVRTPCLLRLERMLRGANMPWHAVSSHESTPQELSTSHLPDSNVKTKALHVTLLTETKPDSFNPGRGGSHPRRQDMSGPPNTVVPHEELLRLFRVAIDDVT